MTEFKNKNDYSITVYHNNQKVLFTEYVHSVYTYVNWLKKCSVQWSYILVYVRRTRQILCYYKNGDYIHNKPTFASRGNIKNGW